MKRFSWEVHVRIHRGPTPRLDKRYRVGAQCARTAAARAIRAATQDYGLRLTRFISVTFNVRKLGLARA